MQSDENFTNSTSTPNGNTNKFQCDLRSPPNAPRPSKANSEYTDHLSISKIEHNRQLSMPSIPRLSLTPKPLFCKNILSKVSFDINQNGLNSIDEKLKTKSFLLTSDNSKSDIECFVNNAKKNSNIIIGNTSRISMLKCRICLETDKTDEKLMSPCRCKGTVGLMHSTCLEQWIKISGKEQCEICKCNYDMRKRRADLNMWLRHLFRQKAFIGDLLCFLFLVPCTTVAVFFCFKAALFLFSPTGMAVESQAQWRGIGLIVLSVLLIFCLLIWITYTVKHYVRHFQIYRSNQYKFSIHNRRKSTIARSMTPN